MPTDVLPEAAAWPVASEVAFTHWQSGTISQGSERVAEEVPVALVYNGISHAVMMATPADLEDFALGFSLSEGILQGPRELFGVELTPQAQGIEIRMDVAAERFGALKERRRNLTGRTGCGLCGTESLQHAVRHPAPVGGDLRVTALVVQSAVAELRRMQELHEATGATHAAGWADRNGKVLLVREDVGRHNALDKLLGAMFRQGLSCTDGFVVLTSRASYEMVQKSATVGIALVVAVSAPTALAIQLARETDMTLVGFVRPDRHTIYANPQRISK